MSEHAKCLAVPSIRPKLGASDSGQSLSPLPGPSQFDEVDERLPLLRRDALSFGLESH